MEEIRFGYRLPANNFVIGIFTLILFPFAIASPIMWESTDNLIYLLAPLGLYLLSLLISYTLAKRHFLIINCEGIALNYILRKRKFVKWDAIDNFVYIEEGENKNGWAVYKKDAKNTDNDNVIKETCALFIPENLVSASSETVTYALKKGFQEYVWHDRQGETPYENLTTRNEWPIGTFSLILVWIALVAFYFFLDHIWTPFNMESIMEYTLVRGNLFNANPSMIIFILWMISYCVVVFMPFYVLKHNRTSSIVYGGVLIGVTLFAALYSLPEKRKVYLNCSEPIMNPIETIEATVNRNDYEVSTVSPYRYYFIEISLTYEGKYYKIEWGQRIKDAYKGMPAVVKLQKGARGLPIVHEVAIPEIGWSVNLLGEAYNKISYEYLEKGQIDKAIETIDKAIALAPNVANYYDSKGEFLFRKGDKKGALEMWIKVISLDPDFDQKHDSYLSRQMYN